jgi:hypothetical protein
MSAGLSLALLSLALRRCAQLAAALFGIMMLLFECLLHIPKIVSGPGNRIFWAVALRDLVFSMGALALAVSQTNTLQTRGRNALLRLARLVIAIAILLFSVEHFLHPEFAPGVPLRNLTPAWILIRVFWG